MFSDQKGLVVALCHRRPGGRVKHQGYVAFLFAIPNAKAVRDEVRQFSGQGVALHGGLALLDECLFKFQHPQEHQGLFTGLQVAVDVAAGTEDLGCAEGGALESGDFAGFDGTTVGLEVAFKSGQPMLDLVLAEPARRRRQLLGGRPFFPQRDEGEELRQGIEDVSAHPMASPQPMWILWRSVPIGG